MKKLLNLLFFSLIFFDVYSMDNKYDEEKELLALPMDYVCKKNNKDILANKSNEEAFCNKYCDMNYVDPKDNGLKEEKFYLSEVENKNIKELDTRYPNGLSLLHIATWFKYLQVVEALLAKKVNVDIQVIDPNYPNGNDEGDLWHHWTALRFAIQQGVSEKSTIIIKMLLNAGADYTLKDAYGKTPLDKAIDYKTGQLVAQIKYFTEKLWNIVQKKQYDNLYSCIEDIKNKNILFILGHFKIGKKSFLSFKNKVEYLINELQNGAQVSVDLSQFKQN